MSRPKKGNAGISHLGKMSRPKIREVGRMSKQKKKKNAGISEDRKMSKRKNGLSEGGKIRVSSMSLENPRNRAPTLVIVSATGFDDRRSASTLLGQHSRILLSNYLTSTDRTADRSRRPTDRPTDGRSGGDNYPFFFI